MFTREVNLRIQFFDFEVSHDDLSFKPCMVLYRFDQGVATVTQVAAFGVAITRLLNDAQVRALEEYLSETHDEQQRSERSTRLG